jgi:predicted nucleic acid-binding protein
VILVDTSVWVNHLGQNDAALAERLDVGGVLAHPFIIGELALGQIKQRKVILSRSRICLAPQSRPMKRF